MSTASFGCQCGATVEGADQAALEDAFVAHVRAAHADWPYSDVAVRNYAAATQRLAPVRERVAEIGDVEVHRVTEDRIDDWLTFFDREAFADKPEWAACYCAEPHLTSKGAGPGDFEDRTWQHNREAMIGLLRSGRSHGYLAYVDGQPAAWVNASLRSEQALYREGESDDAVISVSCFVVAPPFRRHGLAERLLARVIADAPARGAASIEAYPLLGERTGDAENFRGPRAMLEAGGFEPVRDEGRYTVMRLAVGSP